MQKVDLAKVNQGKSRQDSFTLVELLVVIAIIGILVAITLQAASGVMASAARNRAGTEIQAMTTALESYKNDNGAYPQVNVMNTSGATVTPTYTTVDGSGTTTNYSCSSEILYIALAGRTNYIDPTSTNGGQAYMQFKSGQLGNVNNASGTVTGNSSTYILDPWSYSYGYNTGTGGGGATTNYPYNGNGFFDLWSTCGLITSMTTAPNYFTNMASWKCSWQ